MESQLKSAQNITDLNQTLIEQNEELEARLDMYDRELEEERGQHEAELEESDARAKKFQDMLEQSERDMTELVDEVRNLQQLVYEADTEKNVMAEQMNWQVEWLKSNYTLAYQEMNKMLNTNAQLAGHQNIRQKIRYVQQLKEDNIALKREKLVLAKARDGFCRKVDQLERELEAYKVIGVNRKKTSRAERFVNAQHHHQQQQKGKTVRSTAKPLSPQSEMGDENVSSSRVNRNGSSESRVEKLLAAKPRQWQERDVLDDGMKEDVPSQTTRMGTSFFVPL